ncbi:hypothetical protein Aduo_012920 [Ancylostoma duodenale]
MKIFLFVLLLVACVSTVASYGEFFKGKGPWGKDFKIPPTRKPRAIYEDFEHSENDDQKESQESADLSLFGVNELNQSLS